MTKLVEIPSKKENNCIEYHIELSNASTSDAHVSKFGPQQLYTCTLSPTETELAAKDQPESVLKRPDTRSRATCTRLGARLARGARHATAATQRVAPARGRPALCHARRGLSAAAVPARGAQRARGAAQDGTTRRDLQGYLPGRQRAHRAQTGARIST